MIRTQISLEERVYRDAKAQARREHISLAEFFRRALSAALRGRRTGKGTPQTWMRHAGTLASGDAHASSTVNAVVYNRPCVSLDGARILPGG